MRVSIVGGSGYVGGELLRLLSEHPEVEISQVTSESQAGKYVYMVHPNLRKKLNLKFCKIEELKPCDFLFLALPHGESCARIEDYFNIAPRIIDLSSDFRLKDAAMYEKYYGYQHPKPELLEEAVYGIPELHREEIKKARLVSGAGCLATAAILSMYPLFKAGVVRTDVVVVEAKVGSSAGGHTPNAGSHHPERSGAVRPFQPTSHRHTAEIRQELGFNGEYPKVYFSATAVELVRGALATCHVFLREDLSDRELWKIYREVYGSEPFIRIVKERQGIYRYPDPRILAGSNFCDVGFEREVDSGRVVTMGALDNLVKGAAGNGVQAMNVMCGFDEGMGLSFPGLHP